MLEKLYIKNVALIEELEVEFTKGLNILTGETGAGKSIIIDSINFVVGEKADRDFIHSGKDMAEVSAFITIENDDVLAELRNKDIEIADDNSLLVVRTINSDGKTACKINGKTVTLGMLKEVSEQIIDVHGQYEHQSLLNPGKHLLLLDRLCGNNIADNLEKLKERYKSYKAICKSMDEINGDDSDREAKIDLYKFQIDEIKMAELKPNEEEELAARKALISSGVKLKDFANNALEVLYRSENGSASDKIAEAVSDLNNIVQLDSNAAEMYEELEGLSAQLESIVSKIRHYADSVDSDPRLLDDIELRLQLIYDMKRKYGNSIAEIENYAKEAKEKLEFIQNSEEMIMEYTIRKEADERIINKLCEEISSVREEFAVMIGKDIEDVLYDLGMINAVFKIDVEKKPSFDAMGLDKVEFMISANLGEEPKPLAKIASGGEMSRVMLALKVILAKVDTIDTFIFDEIDAGISGRTAQRVAEKMALIAKDHQILCITHLPQIAAMADTHYFIEKNTLDNSTHIDVTRLIGDTVTVELARLIGGAKITDATMKAAEEMKQMADKLK